MAKKIEEVVTARPRNKLAAAVDEVAESLSEYTGEAKGPIGDLLKELIGAFIVQLRSMLPCLNPAPLPVEPVVTSEQQKIAKANAWALKGRAERDYIEEHATYKASTLRQMANQIQRQKRKSGEKIRQDAAIELAHQALDAAREKPLSEMVELILQAQSGV